MQSIIRDVVLSDKPFNIFFSFFCQDGSDWTKFQRDGSDWTKFQRDEFDWRKFQRDGSDWTMFQRDLCMAFRLPLTKSLLVIDFIAGRGLL